MSRFSKKIAVLIAAAVMITAVMVLMAGCVRINLTTDGSEKTDEQPSAGAAEVPASPEEEVLKAVVPPDDFEPMGEYEDKTSQRAMMTITPEGEEGHYSVLISWGSSAFETTIWEFDGDFDRDSGMLTYDNCCKYELTVDENGKQHEDQKYEKGKGALLYYENGFHWDNKKDDDGKECYFYKIDDLSDTVIEEADD